MNEETKSIEEKDNSDVSASQTATESVPETTQTATESVPETTQTEEANPAQKDSPVPVEKDEHEGRLNLRIELKRMLDYVAKYPEIGSTVAQIALKVGEESLARRIAAMGTETGKLRAEYYAIASNVARNERHYDEALRLVREGIDTLEIPLPKDDYNRFVKMVRTGFNVLLFNKKDLNVAPEFTNGLAEAIHRFEESFGEDADFLSIYAQAVWLTDESEAEKIWKRATSAPKNESSWNARGTWYKEVAHDLKRAADTYRKGLENNKISALLAHNLAQVLIDLAQEDEENASAYLGESDRLLHDALRNSKRRGYRRHIHETLDRLKKLRPKIKKAKKKPTSPPPKVGDVVKGKIASLAKFGAFLELADGHRGLLHASNITHEHVHNPRGYFRVGDDVEVKVIEVDAQDDGSFRIGFSRKVLLEDGAPDPRRNNVRRNNNNNNNDNKGRKNIDKKSGGKPRGKGKRDNTKHEESPGATLGELLMAKLNEKS